MTAASRAGAESPPRRRDRPPPQDATRGPDARPQLVFLAGPNGAGKSTFYELFLRDAGLPFLNADVVAAKTGIDSVSAARILDALRERMIEERRGFLTESVFSDPEGAKLAMLQRAVAAGYDVTLIYIAIASPALSAKRVEQRTRIGGHDVPPEKLAPRFHRSLANLRAACDVLPVVKIYDNSSPTDPYRLIAVVDRGRPTLHAIVPKWLRKIIGGRKR